MKTAIFIRSYIKDFHWLHYAVRSINKYCTGFSELILCVPINDLPELPNDIWSSVSFVKTRTEKTKGYIDQQISKLKAHKETDADQILFVDSDCCFFKKCTPESFMREGKPLLLKTPYSHFKEYQDRTGEFQSVLHWQPITERAVGFKVKYEYMRRIPLMYSRETLELIDQKYPTIEDYCCKVPRKEFSEFNFIGAVAEKYHPEKYTISDTTLEPLPEKYAEQYWSWGGLKQDILKQLQKNCE